MKTTHIAALAAVVLAGSLNAAFADTTLVACPGYAVAISEDVAIQGEIMAGTRTAFEQEVCSRSEESADGLKGTKSFPVFIEEMDITTRVIIFGEQED